MRTVGIAFSHRFGRFLLQPAERRLLAGSADVGLGPRAFDLLVALVENSGHLVTKDELLDIVWPHSVVEENSLQVQVSALRKVLGRETIDTVSGRGYRFTLAVTTVAAPTVADAQPATPLHNLPQSLTSFVGREKELVELSQSIRQTRLLTLTGAGGCGKTRLALQLATGVQSMFADGVWLVELAALANPALVPTALGRVLGLQESSTAPMLQRIADHLESKQTLLVLDNAEHLLDACAHLADEVLKRCARTTVVVTSRQGLGITGELTFRVPSLSVPGPDIDSTSERVLQFESVRLFAERARLQRPHFAVTEQNAASLASMCRRLDGIPLAIELAAARSRAMAPEEIDRRMDQRFALLTNGSRTALPRHRTLQSLIDWSYDLLNEPEKRLLCTVSVFADGWTLEGAEDVCAVDAAAQRAMLDRLASLVDKSLVTTDEPTGATRYRLLETVRQYGLERLRDSAEAEFWRSKHLDYFVRLAEEAAPHLKSVEPKASLDRLELEHDNLRAALSWAASGGDVTAGLRLATCVWRFWWLRGYIVEGREFLDSLLALPSQASDAIRGAALTAAGTLRNFQGDSAAAILAHEEALEIHRKLGDRGGIAGSLNSLGNALTAQGDFVRARIFIKEALAIYETLGATRDIAGLLSNLGMAALKQGELAEAQELLAESLSIRRKLSDKWGIATSLLNLAGVASDRGDLVAAQAQGEESLAIYRDLGERRGVAYALGALGGVASKASEWAIARARAEESLAILVELNDQAAAGEALDMLANTYKEEHPERAARIWGGATRLRQLIEFPRAGLWRRQHDLSVAAARVALGDGTAFDRAWSEGGAMTLREISQYALHRSLAG